MMRKWSLPILARAYLAALVTVLFLSCSGESSAPTTPPAPPPFQPQTIVVQLGTRGGATTLISTQAGGWTRNGQPFTSGSTVTGENSASYRLTLTNGTWTAAFIQPDPEAVVLGTSGDAVLLQAQEDGSYHVGGEPLAAGRLVDADNGNQYRLVQGTDGGWTAEFVPPAAQLVHLGTSGESRQVSRTEDGGYTVNGEALAPGSLIRAGNGNRYTLTIGADGMTWTAVFVEGDPQRLPLGTSGDAPLLIYRQENGTFQLNGEPLLGGRVVEASNGNRYRLILGPNRDWQASYIPDPVTVRLGSAGGAVSLTPEEDGTWLRGSASFSSGDRVTGSNGFEYVLTYGADGWFAEAVPMTVEVEVTGSDAQPIQLARLVDGTYLYDGEPVASGDTVTVGGSTYTLRFANNRWTAQFLRGDVFVALGTAGDSLTLTRNADGTYELDGRRVRSGSIQRSPNTGIRYRLRLANGVWSASVYVPPTVDPGGGDPGVGTPPVVAEDIFDALPEELIATGGTFNADLTGADLIKSGVSGNNADGDEIDYARFRGSGRFEDDTFVESVLRAIASILGPIEAQGLAEGTDSQRFVAGVLIDANWPKVQMELNAIFGTANPISFTKPTRAGETDVDEAVDELEDLRDDLSDVAKFKSKFMTRIDTAINDNANLTADKIFNARKRVLALGSSANTRFGVISTLADDATAVSVAGGPSAPGRVPFAFSPLSNTPTTDLPSRGTARYSGRTWAIDNELVLYSGAIELLASIGIEQVKATVSDLRRSDTNASWVHDNKAVREIKLPQINEGDFNDTNGSFDLNTGTNAAEVIFEQSGGLFPASVPDSDLTGQFVGTETGQNAGRAVIGTWKVGTVLDGSFGAERIRTNPATLPSLTSSNRYRVVSRTIVDQTTIVNTDPAAPTLSPDSTGYTDTFPLSSLGSVTNRAQSDNSNLRATIRLRNTSFARFGVWKVVDSTNDPAVTTNGLFAYSPLADTDFGTNANYYPLRVDAEYAGRTVAIDGAGKLYEGSYLLTVNWNAAGSSSNSSLTAVISGLSGFTIGGVGVSQIGFSHTFTGDDFNSTSAPRVRYSTGSDVTLTGGTSYLHEGQFVGNNGPDGPYGVFGRWTLDQSATDSIKGAFGADLVRAP